MATLIEQRTIGAIPDSERHGRAWHLLPLGFSGAALPNLLAIIMYIGYFASAGVIGGQAIASIFGLPTWSGIVLCNLATWLIAFAGYRVIHAFDRAMALVSVAVLVLLFVEAITHFGTAAPAEAHPSFATFFLMLSIAASWQITFAPYVSDYSRYLPRAQGGAKTFWFTLIGSCTGAILFMALGAVVAVYALDDLNSDAIVYLSGLSPIGAPLIALVLVLGMIGANCDNLYGPYLAGLSTVTQAGGPPHVSRLVRGLVNIKAIVTYVVAVLVEIPFMSCALFVGPLATALGGVDIAWVVGLVVAGGLHYVLNRSAAARDAELATPPLTATAAATA